MVCPSVQKGSLFYTAFGYTLVLDFTMKERKKENERLYECSTCGARYYAKNSVFVHYELAHPEKVAGLWRDVRDSKE